MKIVTWNCNWKFREKFKSIAEEDSDIYIIQECEDPSQANNEEYLEFAGDNYYWRGNYKDKGLGVFAKEEIPIKNIVLKQSLESISHNIEYILLNVLHS